MTSELLLDPCSNWDVQSPWFYPHLSTLPPGTGNPVTAPSVFTGGETRACPKISAGLREYTAKEKAPQNSLTFTAEEAGVQLTLSIGTEQMGQQE